MVGHRRESGWPRRNNRQRTKATFEVNVYLVPGDPSRVPPGAGDQVLAYLERHAIVGAYFDLGLGWLAPGSAAHTAFPQVPSGRAVFEYAIVWHGADEFVPNAHTGPFGARCACGAPLDDELHEFLAAQAAGTAVHEARIRCPCGRATPPGELATDVPIAVTGLYVNFCHVDCIEVDPRVLGDLGSLVGSPLRVLRERL